MCNQKLFIHVGIDKTGSSYIQKILNASEEGLYQSNLKYLDSGGLENHSNLFFQSQKGDLNLWKHVALEMNEIEQDGIVSHEGLYHLSEETLSKISEIISGYQINIVIYIRQQSDMICSGFAQRLKYEPSFFGLDSDPETAFFPIGQRYSTTLQKLKNVFGQMNVIVRKYESSYFHQQHLFLDFLHAIGRSCKKNHLSARFSLPNDDPNPSFDIECIYLMLEFDRMRIDKSSRAQLVNLLMSVTLNDNSSFITDDDLDSADQYFQEDNDLVSREWFDGGNLFTAHRKFRYRAIRKDRLSKYVNEIRHKFGLTLPGLTKDLGGEPKGSLNLDNHFVVRAPDYTLKSNLNETNGLTTHMISKQGSVDYSINDSAAMVFQCCRDPIQLTDLMEYFSEKYPENSSVKLEISDLLDLFNELGLIKLVQNQYQSRYHLLNNQSELGVCSKTALRLVDYCLGEFKDKPVLPCTKDLAYLNSTSILLLETCSDSIVISSTIERENNDQKKIVDALISQHAIIQPSLSCWLVRGDSYGLDCDPEQGLHIAGMRHSSLRHLVLVPTANRERYLGLNLKKQMEVLSLSWVPWEEKTDTAWWGGALTGDQWKDIEPRSLTRRETLCYYRDKPSEQVRLDLTQIPDYTNEPPGIKLKNKFTKQEVFTNKCLVLLPGNDIASGSSWYFAGNSVVLMPEPHLEHILYFEIEPWVHYIPLEPDPADILIKLRWVFENQGRAKKIVENAHQRLRWFCGPEYQWACNEVLRRISNTR